MLEVFVRGQKVANKDECALKVSYGLSLCLR